MRISKGRLERDLKTLQDDLVERMHEGFWRRIYRWWFIDPDVRLRYKLALGAEQARKNEEKTG